MGLKKSETTKGLRDKLLVYSLPTHIATPQRPLAENGVKKSSTAQRPEENKRSRLIIGSIESILKLKTHPDIEEAGVATKERYLVSRVLQDRESKPGTLLSRKIEIPSYNYEGEVFRRVQAPRVPTPWAPMNGDLAAKTLSISISRPGESNNDSIASEVGLFRRGQTSRNAIPHPPTEGTGGDSLASEVGLFRRGQTSRNPIPHPPLEGTGGDSLGKKRTFVFTDDTSKILERKTLLYSEPLYRPQIRKEPVDPRRLISILGDPLPFKRSDIATNQDTSRARKRMHVNVEHWRHMHRKGHRRGAHHRKAHFKHHRKAIAPNYENWDQDEQVQNLVSL